MEAPEKSLDRLEREVAELRASRMRLAVSHDADRRTIERELHDGPQQQLVALSVNLQLARDLVDSDAVAAKKLLDELGSAVQRALDAAVSLAERIYPPLLDVGGLGVALRTAAVRSGVQATIAVPSVVAYPPEIAGAVYFSCLDVLERAGQGGRAAIDARVVGGELVFEVSEDGVAAPASGEDALDRVRDRVEALGGRVTVESNERGVRVSGSLPLSR